MNIYAYPMDTNNNLVKPKVQGGGGGENGQRGGRRGTLVII